MKKKAKKCESKKRNVLYGKLKNEAKKIVNRKIWIEVNKKSTNVKKNILNEFKNSKALTLE